LLQGLKKDPVLQRTFGEGRIAVHGDRARTSLTRLYQEGAFKARVLQPPGQAHLDIALINTAGGLTGGDEMRLDIHAGENGQCAIATQACEKFYKSGGGTAHVKTTITMDHGAALNWLPQEAIVFNGADVQRTINVELPPSARLLLAESIIFGRTSSGEDFQTGQFSDRWDIRMNGQLVHCERLRMEGPVAAHRARLNGHKAMATILLMTPDAHNFINPVRRALKGTDALGGASAWDLGAAQKLIIRLLAVDGYTLRKAVMPVLSLLGQGRTVPRLWNA